MKWAKYKLDMVHIFVGYWPDMNLKEDKYKL